VRGAGCGIPIGPPASGHGYRTHTHPHTRGAGGAGQSSQATELHGQDGSCLKAMREHSSELLTAVRDEAPQSSNAHAWHVSTRFKGSSSSPFCPRKAAQCAEKATVGELHAEGVDPDAGVIAFGAGARCVRHLPRFRDSMPFIAHGCTLRKAVSANPRARTFSVHAVPLLLCRTKRVNVVTDMPAIS